MDNMCDVPSHLHDHIYWRRESSRSQEVTSSNKAAESRKRQGEQVSSTRDLDEAPQRRHHEDADILLERSSSPQPNPSAPQARLDGVQQEEEESQQEDQRWELHEPMADYVMPLPLWPRPYSPHSGALPHSVVDTVVEIFMSWMTDTPYNPEM
ncbi:hypothetical protein Q8A73_010424 [Channa argus]|nr:hypothetical protein Q8A73_010424 [Channa argus]